jgi:hypothetical protein
MPVRAPSTPSRSSRFTFRRTDPGGLLWRWIGPLRLGRLPGDIVVEHFILESRHTRTADEPGKASPGLAMGEQFAKLTRVANAKRWPEQLEA